MPGEGPAEALPVRPGARRRHRAPPHPPSGRGPAAPPRLPRREARAPPPHGHVGGGGGARHSRSRRGRPALPRPKREARARAARAGHDLRPRAGRGDLPVRSLRAVPRALARERVGPVAGRPRHRGPRAPAGHARATGQQRAPILARRAVPLREEPREGQGPAPAPPRPRRRGVGGPVERPAGGSDDLAGRDPARRRPQRPPHGRSRLVVADLRGRSRGRSPRGPSTPRTSSPAGPRTGGRSGSRSGRKPSRRTGGRRGGGRGDGARAGDRAAGLDPRPGQGVAARR